MTFSQKILPPGHPAFIGPIRRRGSVPAINIPLRILQLLKLPTTPQLQARVSRLLNNDIKIGGRKVDIFDKASGKIHEAFLPLVAHVLYHQLVKQQISEQASLVRYSETISSESPEMEIYIRLYNTDIVSTVTKESSPTPAEVDTIVSIAFLLGPKDTKACLFPFANKAILNTTIELCNRDPIFAEIYLPYLVSDANPRVRQKVAEGVKKLPRKAVEYIIYNERNPRILFNIIKAENDIRASELEMLFKDLQEEYSLHSPIWNESNCYKLFAMQAIILHPNASSHLLNNLSDKEELRGGLVLVRIGHPKLKLEKAMDLARRFLTTGIGHRDIAKAFAAREDLTARVIKKMVNELDNDTVITRLFFHPNTTINIQALIFTNLFKGKYYPGGDLQYAVFKAPNLSRKFLDRLLLKIIPKVRPGRKYRNRISSSKFGWRTHLKIKLALNHPNTSQRARERYINWHNEFLSAYPKALEGQEKDYAKCQTRSQEITQIARETLANPPVHKEKPAPQPQKPAASPPPPPTPTSQLIEIMKQG